MLKSDRGFTVIEIIFAFALLAVGLAEVVAILGEGQYHDSLSGKNAIALTLAQEQMESIKNQAYASVNSVVLTPYTSPYVDYSYQVIVTQIPLGPPTGQIKDVVVRVTYAAAKQATNPGISLETYVGNY